MNDSMRFIKTMTFEPPDRIPLWECAFWNETLIRWADEGMPQDLAEDASCEKRFCEHFGYDRSFGIHFRNTVRINIGMSPGFDHKVLSDEDGVVTELGRDGVISKWSRNGNHTRQFIEFPVKTRKDLENLKKQFDPDDKARYKNGWLEKAEGLKSQGAPVCINAGGYYGFARELMGLENLSYALYDDIGLIEAIFEMRTEYMSVILEKVLKEIKPDFAEFWEDMAYKTGPLISPVLYRKLALSHYKKITSILRKYGVEVILLDSDGNVDDLIPVWLDGGINCIWPFEQAAGMDIIKVRKKYGKSLGLIGGIDKRALSKNKEAIYDEVMSKVPYMIESGGYIPTCDHAVPPDVSYENYMYYLELIKQIAGI